MIVMKHKLSQCPSIIFHDLFFMMIEAIKYPCNKTHAFYILRLQQLNPFLRVLLLHVPKIYHEWV